MPVSEQLHFPDSDAESSTDSLAAEAQGPDAHAPDSHGPDSHGPDSPGLDSPRPHRTPDVASSAPPLEVITDLMAHLKQQGTGPTLPLPPAQLRLDGSALERGGAYKGAAHKKVQVAAIAPEDLPCPAATPNPGRSTADPAGTADRASLALAEPGPGEPMAQDDDDDTAELLPGITLTPEQQQALGRLEAFLDSSEKLHLLTGYAGTGKTTLLQALLVYLKNSDDRRPIVFTALSNKATKVLATMADRWQLKVDCLTCCRLLGLQPTIDKETGQQKFTSDRKGKRLINRYRLVVVDECSMINQEMWDLLVKAVSRLDDQTQLLFVGDQAQLPPVGEVASPCFEQIYDRTDLTEVVRYGGAIGLLAEDVRRNLDRPLMPRWESDRTPDNTQGTFILPPPQWNKLLLRAFTSESYSRSPDQVRVLAYTNRRVQQLNQRIRAAIYGADAAQFVVGERLMANSPCLIDDNQIVLQSSEECEVLEAYIDHLDDPVMLERWQVWRMDIVTEAGLFRELRVLHSQDKKRFEKVLKGLADGKSWKAFWELKQYFHDLNYAYSLTVHKSQGSTFQDVFVDLPNLMINRKITERNQLCYVAFTRAANRLFLQQ